MTERIDPIPKEARIFQGRRAGLVTRAAAAAVDVGVVVVVLVVAYFAYCVALFLIPPGRFEFPVPPLWLDIVAGYVVMTLYLTSAWHSGGRTYGCHVMGLRVLGRDGKLMHLVPALLRAAFCVAFPLGFVWVAVSSANRSIQDVVLRTSVVYDWDVRPRARSAPLTPSATAPEAAAEEAPSASSPPTL